MTDELFDFEDDVYIETVYSRQKHDMDTLRLYITALRKAHTELQNEYKDKMRGPARVVFPPQPTISLKDEMVCTAEKKTPYGKAGDLDTLSYVKVGNDAPHGKEFYHHCPMHGNDLIRLHYVKQDDVHACPVCKLVFR